MNKALNLIKHLNITNKEYIVLACSYGPDSMVLLDLLKKTNLKIIVAHVNHKLRKESDEEEILLKEYCKLNNLIFELRTINKKIDRNFEMEARNIRYDFFESLIKKYNAKYLFTAHHGDDLIETILMRLTRGSSLKGYAGFNTTTKKEKYTLVRPLIYYSKEEIMNYVKINKIPYAIDYTNNEEKYLRNRFRLNILPELKKENENVHLKFLDFNQEINQYEEYFNKETNIIYNVSYINNNLYLDRFNSLDNIFKKRILQKILYEIYKKDIINIHNNHLDLIFKLIDSPKKNSLICLPNNLYVHKMYDKLLFNFKAENSSYNYELKDNINLINGSINFVSKVEEEKSNYVIRLNSSEIKLPLYVRSRIDGDKIKVKNLGGTQKISSIFIDSKLTLPERNNWPIVHDSNNEILWIPGIKKSIFDKQKQETYDIILKYEKKERFDEK